MGRLNVLVQPGWVHFNVFNSEGNFFRPGENGVLGVSADWPSSEKSFRSPSYSSSSSSSSDRNCGAG